MIVWTNNGVKIIWLILYSFNDNIPKNFNFFTIPYVNTAIKIKINIMKCVIKFIFLNSYISEWMYPSIKAGS
jgi:hypothetical protein